MNKTLASFLLVATAAVASACGPEPTGPLGVCFHFQETEDGRPVPGHTVWRPCEDFDEIRADGRDCKVHVLDRVEYHSRSEPDVMTEEECYGR
jgi:hypothetical protein